MADRINRVTNYSYNKNQRDGLFFSNLFWYTTLHVSDRFTVHHHESSTVYTAKVFVTQVMLSASDIRMEILMSLASNQHNPYDKHPLLCIQY